MERTTHQQELDKYVCLLCDEAFLLPADQKLLCPKCGNNDELAFATAELAELNGLGETSNPATSHHFAI